MRLAGESDPVAVREARVPDRAAALSLNLSVGVAELARGDSAASWLQRADGALYAAKKAGGGRVNIATWQARGARGRVPDPSAHAFTPRATAWSTVSPNRSTSSSVVYTLGVMRSPLNSA